MKVNVNGLRKDVKQLFLQFIMTIPTNKSQTSPFIVVAKKVEKCKTVDDLLKYPDETEVLQVWPGKMRSDLFYFTVGDLKKFLKTGK